MSFLSPDCDLALREKLHPQIGTGKTAGMLSFAPWAPKLASLMANPVTYV